MAGDRRQRTLRSTAWLAAHLGDPAVRVLDGSYHLPGSGRDPRLEFAAGHIPGAAFFDIDAICDPQSPLPHMLPAPDAFAAAAGGSGIGNQTTVIVYDAPGSAAAARVWWMFRVFGHTDVAVLDGGLEQWLAEGRPVTDDAVVRPVQTFEARFNSELVRSAENLFAAIDNGAVTIVDNRNPERFAGAEPEPRPVRRLGRIPGSVNLPFTAFFEPGRPATWKPDEGLAAAFAAAGLEPGTPLVASCGSGVTACTTALAAFVLGHEGVAVYDGSWAEWGNRDDPPIEV